MAGGVGLSEAAEGGVVIADAELGESGAGVVVAGDVPVGVGVGDASGGGVVPAVGVVVVLGDLCAVGVGEGQDVALVVPVGAKHGHKQQSTVLNWEEPRLGFVATTRAQGAWRRPTV